MNAAVKDRLTKLLALAERGVGGEAATARRKLEAALHRAGLTLDDLGTDTRDEQQWTFRGPLERRLLRQILATVLGREHPVYKYRRRSVLATDVTPAERVRVDLLWTAHRKALRQEIDLLFGAYLHAQHLFPAGVPESADPCDELSDADLHRLERMAAMMMGIERVHVHPQLSHHTTGKD